MSNRCIVLFCLIFVTQLEAVKIPNLKKGYAELINFAKNVIQSDEYDQRKVLVLYWDNDVFINEFFSALTKERLKSTIVTMRLEDYNISLSNGNDVLADLGIIVLNEMNYMNMEEIIFNIELKPIWNVRRRYLVLAAAVENDNSTWIEESFQSFWERQVLRVIICYWYEEMKIFTFNPFYENFAIDITKKVNNVNSLYSKRIRNMNGYVLKLFHIDYMYKSNLGSAIKNGKHIWVGKDGFFFQILKQILDCDLEFHLLSSDVPITWYNNIDIDVPVQDFFDVMMDMYDFDALANVAGVIANFDTLDHVFEIERNDMFILTPKSSQIPRYLYIFLIFPLDIWMATFISLTVVGFILYIIRKYYFKNTLIGDSFLDNYRLLLNTSMPNRDQKTPEKLVIISWLLYAMVFATLFQTLLTSSLMSPKYYDEIDTLEELFQTDLKIMVPLFSRKLIMTDINEEDKPLDKHFISMSQNITLLGINNDWIDLYLKDIGFTVYREQINFIRTKIDLEKNWHVMKKSILPYIRAYYIRRNKQFYEEINDLVAILNQAGLYLYQRRYNYGIEDKGKSKADFQEKNNEDEKMSLTLEHLQVAFVLLIVGSTFATLSLIVEFIVFYSCKK